MDCEYTLSSTKHPRSINVSLSDKTVTITAKSEQLSVFERKEFTRKWQAKAFYEWLSEVTCFESLYHYMLGNPGQQLRNSGVSRRINYAVHRVLPELKQSEYKKHGTIAIDAGIPDTFWRPNNISKIDWWL
jgi:hypothetical protein